MYIADYSGTSNECTPTGTKRRKRKQSKMGTVQNLYSDESDESEQEVEKTKSILKKARAQGKGKKTVRWNRTNKIKQISQVQVNTFIT